MLISLKTMYLSVYLSIGNYTCTQWVLNLYFHPLPALRRGWGAIWARAHSLFILISYLKEHSMITLVCDENKTIEKMCQLKVAVESFTYIQHSKPQNVHFQNFDLS